MSDTMNHKILCFGSLNIDHVYSVDHFVAKGETLSSQKLETFTGGKGLNQSVALARAGARRTMQAPSDRMGLFSWIQ